MESKARLSDVSVGYDGQELKITFAIPNTYANREGLQTIQNLPELSLKATKYRKKRSIDANAYAWVLMTRLSEKLATSKDEVYEHMLERYGSLYLDDSGAPMTITVKKEVDIGRFIQHAKKISDNGKFTAYLVLKGSSEYDTTEMKRFIDGIISECKELGIETMTPDELQQMKGYMG